MFYSLWFLAGIKQLMLKRLRNLLISEYQNQALKKKDNRDSSLNTQGRLVIKLVILLVCFWVFFFGRFIDSSPLDRWEIIFICKFSPLERCFSRAYLYLTLSHPPPPHFLKKRLHFCPSAWTVNFTIKHHDIMNVITMTSWT